MATYIKRLLFCNGVEEEEYRELYALEDQHWWFHGNRNVALGLLGRYRQPTGQYTVLDAGCGTGLNMVKLSPWGEVTGIDISPQAIEFCEQRGLNNVVLGAVERTPFPNNAFDIVTCFGVLYHKAVDDRRAVNELARVCKQPGGLVLITTPAMKFLRWKMFRTPHDELQHTGRRHSKKELKKLLKDAGFQVKKISYYTTILFIPVTLARLLTNLKRLIQPVTPKTSDLTPPPRWIGKILEWTMQLETLIIPHVSLPFGVGLVAVGEKKME